MPDGLNTGPRYPWRERQPQLLIPWKDYQVKTLIPATRPKWASRVTTGI